MSELGATFLALIEEDMLSSTAQERRNDDGHWDNSPGDSLPGNQAPEESDRVVRD